MTSVGSNEGFILNGLRQNVIRFFKDNELVSDPDRLVASDSYEGNEGRSFTHVEAIKGVTAGFITLIKTGDEYTGFVEINHAILAKYKYVRKQWQQVSIDEK